MQKSAIALIVMALLAGGCAAPQKPEGTAEQLCRSWREIGIRKADRITTDTAREIVANNEARPEWCGKIAEAKR